jgi:hypothetical protein
METGAQDNDGLRIPALPRGLLGTVVLIAIIEAAVARHDLDLTNPAPLCWGYVRATAIAEARSCTILCLGTSLVKNGVVPRVLERRLDAATFNLALFNGQMASSYFVLKQALDAGARPRALVIDCQDDPEEPTESGKGLWVNQRQWPELIGVADTFDLALTARDPRFFATVLISRVFPSCKARFEVRNVLTAALHGHEGSSRESAAMLLRNWRQNRGAQVLPVNSAPPTPMRAPVPEVNRDEGPQRGNRVCAVYADRLLALAAARGITVYWLLPPIGPAQQAARNADGRDAYFTELARTAQSHGRDVVVIDARRSGYGPDAFWDGVHLDRRGAVALSGEVAEVIAQRTGANAPRWVVLPKYRPRVPEVPLEDVLESRVAVGSSGAERRQ